MLPEVSHDGEMSLEKAVLARRSHRAFKDKALSLKQVAQLVWAGQGITGPDRRRSAPSAGALYPLEVYAVAGRITDLAAGVYQYQPGEHALKPVIDGDRRREVAGAALNQGFIAEATLVLVIAGIEEKTASKYGERAGRYVLIEAGCSAENIHLQAEALGLKTVIIGAFHDARLRKDLHLSHYEVPLVVMPVGYSK